MKKIGVFLLSLGLIPAANAEVSGVFNCQGKIISVVRANGRTVRQTAYASSTVTYFPGGAMTGTTPISPYVSRGTWVQRGKALFGYPDINDAARDAIYGCSLTGANCIFVGATTSSKGTVNKAETVIKGVSKINLSMIVNGVMANNNATNTFTCFK
jgi:hypothetical protein